MTQFRGRKIPSNIILELQGALYLLGLKVIRTEVGAFNQGDIAGKVLLSSIQLPASLVDAFNRLKQKHHVTHNDILLAIIIRSYLTHFGSQDIRNAPIRVLVPLNLRTSEEQDSLGNLVVPQYVTISQKRVSTNEQLLIHVKQQMDANKKSTKTLGALILMNIRKLSLEAINIIAEKSFGMATLQVTNIGSFSSLKTEILDIADVWFFVKPKPGLSSVLSVIKRGDQTIRIGLSYEAEAFSKEEASNFLNCILETAKAFISD